MTTSPEPTPPIPTTGDERARKTGRQLVGQSVFNLVALCVIGFLAWVIVSQARAIEALSNNVQVSRTQFDACKGKPAGTRGCQQPAAPEPSVIIRQVNVPVQLPGVPGSQGRPGDTGAPGATGQMGLPGRDGLPGKDGKDGVTPPCLSTAAKCQGSPGIPGVPGPPGRDGKDGVSPPCMAEETQCRGRDGKDGVDGKDGQDGKDGADGTSPPCLDEPMRCQGSVGADGRGIAKTTCPGDGDPTTDDPWVIIYTKGEPVQETVEGSVCRQGTAP